MRTTPKERYEVTARLRKLGISSEDAQKLRRISLTLRRWFELECGDSNGYGSWAIERDPETDRPFVMHHHYAYGAQPNRTTRRPIADRETGARTRLATILAKYPTLHVYVQTDPRGAALYLLTDEQVARYDNKPLEQIYSHGLAVY